MATLTIRLPEADYDALKIAAGDEALEAWARRTLLAAAAAPVVRARYGYRATGPGKATILRHGDGPNAIGGGAADLSQEQMSAYQRAKALIQRNAPGDQAAAVALLQSMFEIVVETAV